MVYDSFAKEMVLEPTVLDTPLWDGAAMVSALKQALEHGADLMVLSLSLIHICAVLKRFARQRAWNSICSANAQKGGACITLFGPLEGESF